MTTAIQRLNLLKSIGYEITKKTAILDFGCGNGLEVQMLRLQGYNIYGCDIKIETSDPRTNSLLHDGVLQLIDPKNYKLPFEDNTFDLIYSYQVLEHVKNPQVVIREISRVLKFNGITYHHFPTKLRIIEPHTKVPFASAISSGWWLTFWSFCGIRNKYQKNLSVKETVEWNKKYLKSYTNYLSNRRYLSLFRIYFKNMKHCEKAFLSEIFRGKKTGEIIINITAFIFRIFHSAILVGGNPKK